MNDLNTQQLAERAKNGDKAAFDELYRAYSEPLVKFVIKQGLNEFDAQDVVSETFIKAMNSIGQLQDTSKFSTWLHTIAKRTAGEHREKAGRHQRVELNSSDSDNGSASGDSAAVDIAFQEAYGDTVMLPVDYAENEDIKWLIAEQINSLSPAQKETLFLFYYKNKSIAEISELTGSSQSSVKANLSYARSNLKKKLEELKKKGIVLCAVPFMQFIPHFSDAFEDTAAGSSAASGQSAAPQTVTVGSQAAAAAGGFGLKAVIIAVAAAVTVGVGAFALMSVFKGSEDKTSSTVSVGTSKAETAGVQSTTPAVSSLTVSSEAESSEPPEDTIADTLAVCKTNYIEKLKELIPDDAGDIQYIIEDIDGDGLPEIDVSYGYDLNPEYEQQLKNPTSTIIIKYKKNDNMIMSFKDGAVIHNKSEGTVSEKLFYRLQDSDGKGYSLILKSRYIGFASREYSLYKLEGSTISGQNITDEEYIARRKEYEPQKIECKAAFTDSKEKLISAVEAYFQAKS
ncbi:MAG: sigma-70 family RNA polymerase sigma factor [Ruminococcus sp.]|nr:sigma-70 family RNA polymerase sigma factor [Ruminococcus sp.]